MKMKKTGVILLCLLMLGNIISFAGKQEKKHKVKSTTILQTVSENGKAITYKESTETFDKFGNSTAYCEYAKDGTVTEKRTAVYDNNQNLIEETHFSLKTNKNTKKTYKYTVIKDKTPLVEETEFSGSGTVLKKTVYTYNASGKKASETVTDASGNMISKTLFIYNAKNLKSHKQNFNKSNVLESSKEWQYDYY